MLPYHERFVARYPDVHALAAAPLDDVLALWSGSVTTAARVNLHRCAQAVSQRTRRRSRARHAARHAARHRLLDRGGDRGVLRRARVAIPRRQRQARKLTRVLGFGGDPAEVANERAVGRGDGAAARARHRALHAGPDGPRRDACWRARRLRRLPVAPDCRARKARQPRALPGEDAPPGAARGARIAALARVARGRVWLEQRPTRRNGRAVDAAAVPGRSVQLVAAAGWPGDARGVADARASADALDWTLHPRRATLARKPVNDAGAVGPLGGAARSAEIALPVPACAACSCRPERCGGRLCRPRPLPRRYSSTIFSRSSGSLSSSSFCLAARLIGRQLAPAVGDPARLLEAVGLR